MEHKYSCIVADDEPLARRLIVNYLSNFNNIELLGEFRNANEVKDFLLSQEVDLIFLDIRMPGITGIGLLEELKDPPLTIITTAYEEYAVRAFELEVMDYLVKPFPLERFGKAISKFIEFYHYKRSANQQTDYLFIRSSYGVKRIEHDQIKYVVAKKEYMQLILVDQLPDLVYIRMKELEDQLGERFVRIHKSFLVNISKIDSIEGDYVIIKGEKLKISRNYKKEVRSKVNK